ncbi:hypothetical protein GCM10009788_38740 [Nocardioides humi]|uniref:Uncharacterized protein n=1 Tax=Nocardioides humi TaxID=449461 RepID=A0ABN2B2P7_9ACTN
MVPPAAPTAGPRPEAGADPGGEPPHPRRNRCRSGGGTPWDRWWQGVPPKVEESSAEGAPQARATGSVKGRARGCGRGCTRLDGVLMASPWTTHLTTTLTIRLTTPGFFGWFLPGKYAALTTALTTGFTESLSRGLS